MRTSGGPLPIEVAPEAPGMDLAAWAADSREVLASLLARHGAVALTGFAVGGAAELQRVAEAAGTELYADYGDLPRETMGGKVYGTTPYPEDQTIHFHNESSHQHRFPRRIFFLCLTPPSRGGTTPLVDGRRALAALPRPLAERFAREGLRYVRTFTPGIDVSWQQFFRTEDPRTVEARCRAEGIDLEWRSGGRLRTAQRAPAVIRHPETGERAFFNQLLLHHPSRLPSDVRDALRWLVGDDDLPRDVTWGGGEPIERAVVDEVATTLEALAVDRPWRRGDVVMVDNLLVAHGRRPFSGPRKVVVAMGSMLTQGDVAERA